MDSSTWSHGTIQHAKSLRGLTHFVILLTTSQDIIGFKKRGFDVEVEDDAASNVSQTVHAGLRG